jgi:hypothetical protein
MIELFTEGDKTVPRELWQSRKMAVSHGSIVRVGDLVLGSSGRGQGPALLVALDIRAGQRVWVERGFDTANLLRVDDKLIIHTEDGRLVLATAARDGLKVLAESRITQPLSWTAPSLVGTTLYVRDRKHIMALDLG